MKRAIAPSLDRRRITEAVISIVRTSVCWLLREGVFTPIISDARQVAYADPVSLALILTAIVIGFSIQALMLVGAIAPRPR